MKKPKRNFTFDKSLITKLATMRYQIIPIYSFLDENEEIQLLIGSKLKRNFIKDEPITWEDIVS